MRKAQEDRIRAKFRAQQQELAAAKKAELQAKAAQIELEKKIGEDFYRQIGETLAAAKQQALINMTTLWQNSSPVIYARDYASIASDLMAGQAVLLVADTSALAGEWLKAINMSMTSLGYSTDWTEERSWFKITKKPVSATPRSEKPIRRKGRCYCASAWFTSSIEALRVDSVYTRRGDNTAPNWPVLIDELLPRVAPVIDGEIAGW